MTGQRRRTTPVENPQEVKIVQMMFDMYEKGYSSNRLTQYLNDHGIRGKRNGLWRPPPRPVSGRY